MSTVLVVGATRGLGASLVKSYAAQSITAIFGTSRSSNVPSGFPGNVKWLHNIDLMKESVGGDIVKSLGDVKSLSTVVRAARAPMC